MVDIRETVVRETGVREAEASAPVVVLPGQPTGRPGDERAQRSLIRGRNILLVGINFAPEPTGIARYTTGMAEFLAREGATVTVLTGLPHYPSWSVPDAYRHGRRFVERHLVGDTAISVVRLRHTVPRHQSALRRGVYELTFAAHATRAGGYPAPDLVIAATPSLGGAVAAARIAKRHGVPLITVVQDLMAKAAGQSGIRGGGLVASTTERIERYALTRADRVAVVSEAFRPVVRAYGVADEKIDLLPNWVHLPPPTTERHAAREQLGWSSTAFIVAHTGNMGLKQDLGVVVDAGRLLRGIGGDEPPDVKVLLIGDGNQRDSLALQAAAVATVHVLPPVDDAHYPLALAASDVLLVNERATVGDMSLPSKLTSYLNAGRPVLAAVARDGATAAELRSTGGAGLIVAPGDAHALATAILELREDPERRERMAAAGRRYAQQHLSRQASMHRLSTVIDAVLPTRKPPGQRSLRHFTPAGYDKGRGKLWQAAWFATMNLVFSTWWCPARLRPLILRAFGADVGRRVFIRHRVRVLWPWKLSIGDDCWIGEDAWLLNLEPITLANDVCVSQGAMLCTGSHDHRDPAFGYDNAPIDVQPGAWIAARAVVLRGSRIAAGEVVPANSTRGRSADSTRGRSADPTLVRSS